MQRTPSLQVRMKKFILAPLTAIMLAFVVVASAATSWSVTQNISAGQTLTGTYQWNATYLKNGVSGDYGRVEFLVDGVKVSQDLTKPFSFTLDTTQYVNGSHTFRVRGMNGSTQRATNSVLANVNNEAPPPPPPPPPSTFQQGLWAEVDKMSDADLAYVKNTLGYDFVLAQSPADLDRVSAAGLKAVYWLGKYYDDNDTDGPVCTWQKSDSEVVALVNGVKNHPALLYYFVDDEPHDLCPNVRQQFLDRNSVIKAADPTHLTFISENRTEAFDSLANVTDFMVLIAYPCHFGAACSTSNIPGRISAAESAGVLHYWAMREVENEKGTDAYYRYPTGPEYADQDIQWDASRLEGEFGFMGYGVFSGADGIELAPQDLKDAVAARNLAR